MKRFIFMCVFALCAIIISNSCRKDKIENPWPSVPPVQPILLKAITIPNQPSPYYYFRYNPAGQPDSASFASGLFMYNIFYRDNRITEMKNNVAVNKDRLQYVYSNTGQVDSILYIDLTGTMYKIMHFIYDGPRLIELERKLKSATGFVLEKTMTFAYNADGNLKQMTDHRPPVNGQGALTYIDRFEQYDSKINVDGFGLLHNELFEHLFLLPTVQLQKNNPGKQTRAGDGINYTISFNYTYNEKDLPETKKGEVIITSSPGAGQRFQTSAIFSYY